MSEDMWQLREWLRELKENEDRIMVRRKEEGGKLGAYPLTECTPETWARYVTQWLETGATPVYLRKDAE